VKNKPTGVKDLYLIPLLAVDALPNFMLRIEHTVPMRRAQSMFLGVLVVREEVLSRYRSDANTAPKQDHQQMQDKQRMASNGERTAEAKANELLASLFGSSDQQPSQQHAMVSGTSNTTVSVPDVSALLSTLQALPAAAPQQAPPPVAQPYNTVAPPIMYGQQQPISIARPLMYQQPYVAPGHPAYAGAYPPVPPQGVFGGVSQQLPPHGYVPPSHNQPRGPYIHPDRMHNNSHPSSSGRDPRRRF
jgi:hypothetical protein